MTTKAKPRGTKPRSYQARQQARAQARRRSFWFASSIVAAAAVAVFVVVSQREEANDPGSPVVGGDLHSLVTADGTTLYVGGHQAVSTSTDGGQTWSRVSSLDDADAMGWAFLDDSIWMGGHPGLSVSTDGGSTFTQHNEGLPATDIHALGGTGELLYAASPAAGFIASEDGGTTWEVRNPQVGQSFMGHILVDPNDADHAIAPDMQVGAAETTDGGLTWHALGGVPGAMWVSWDPNDVRHIVVSGSGAAAASTDGGATWNPIPIPDGVMVVEIDPSDPGRLYGAAHEGDEARIWVSEDSGGSWSEF
jgi:photosystem II stability/assembly factor-like uncharacterized protein